MKFKEHFYNEAIVPIDKVDQNKAYWLSPSGEIIAVPMTHIDMIRENPERFGLSQEYIDEMIKEHGRLYDGSKSRDVVMSRLMAEGWVRIRKVDSRQGSYWTVQLNTGMGDRIPRIPKNNVKNWAMSMMTSADKYKNHDAIALNQKGQVLFGGNTRSTWKTLEDLVLDDTGVFESIEEEDDDLL